MSGKWTSIQQHGLESGANHKDQLTYGKSTHELNIYMASTGTALKHVLRCAPEQSERIKEFIRVDSSWPGEASLSGKGPLS